jgi:hypothetical protein
MTRAVRRSRTEHAQRSLRSAKALQPATPLSLPVQLALTSAVRVLVLLIRDASPATRADVLQVLCDTLTSVTSDLSGGAAGAAPLSLIDGPLTFNPQWSRALQPITGYVLSVLRSAGADATSQQQAKVAGQLLLTLALARGSVSELATLAHAFLSSPGT